MGILYVTMVTYHIKFVVFLFRHVCVSLKIMEKLLSELSTERLQLLAESYLDMMHELLQSNDLFFQTMAANSVITFFI